MNLPSGPLWVCRADAGAAEPPPLPVLTVWGPPPPPLLPPHAAAARPMPAIVTSARATRVCRNMAVILPVASSAPRRGGGSGSPRALGAVEDDAATVGRRVQLGLNAAMAADPVEHAGDEALVE